MRQTIKRGFALIELIVVLAVIALLTAMLLHSLRGVTWKAKVTSAKVQSKGLWELTEDFGFREQWDLDRYTVQYYADGWAAIGDLDANEAVVLSENDLEPLFLYALTNGFPLLPEPTTMFPRKALLSQWETNAVRYARRMGQGGIRE